MNLLNEVKSSQESPFFSKEGFLEKGEVKGDDVKGAFLALLQGLVGLSNVSMPTNALAPEAKVAKFEVKQEDRATNDEIEFKNENQTEAFEDTSADRDHLKLEQDFEIENNDVVEAIPQVQIAEKTQTEIAEVAVKNSMTVKSETVGKEQNVEIQSKAPENSSEYVENNSENLIKVENAQIREKVTNSSNQNLEHAVSKEVSEEKIAEVASVELLSSRAKKAQNQDLDKKGSNPENPLTSLKDVDHEVVGSHPIVEVEAKSNDLNVSNIDKFDDDQSDSVLDEIKNFILREEKNLVPQVSTSAPKPLLNKNEDRMNSVKDALLARLLVGVDSSILTAASKSSISDSKTNLESVIGLNTKMSGEKVLSEKNVQSVFAKRGVQSQEFVDKIKEVLEKSAINKTNDSISVKIDPPHLGEIRVKITHKHGEIYAKLTPENKEIENVLKTKVNELNNVIQALGFKPDEVHVQIGSETPPILENSRELFQSNENNLNREQKKASGFSYVQKLDVVELSGGGKIESNVVQDSGWVA